MVLLNVNAIAINNAICGENHKSSDNQNHIILVKITCHIHAIEATFQTSFMIDGLSHNQTIKRSNDTQK